MRIVRFTSFLVLLLIFALPGCGDSDSSPTPPTANPAITTAQQSALTSSVDSLILARSLPGVALVITRGTTEPFLLARGRADLGSGRMMTTQDRFRIGDLTRMFTSYVVLQLADEQKLRLTDPVSSWIPQLPNADRITIRHLLHMTSGLLDYRRTTSIQMSYVNNPTKIWSRAYLFNYILSLSPAYSPGDSCVRSNSATYILGMIAEQVTGKSVEELVKTRLCDAWGLSATECATTESISGTASHGYRALQGAPFEDITSLHPSIVWCGGNMVSTLLDVKTALRAMVTGQGLSSAMRMEMLGWRSMGGHRSHGLGLMNRGGLVGYEGEIQGYACFAWHDPSQDLTIVAFVNLCNDDGTRPETENLFAIITRILFGSSAPYL